jgi:hypothetical protein
MENLENFLRWFLGPTEWLIKAVIVGAITFGVAWLLARQKERKKEKRATDDRAVDSQIVRSLESWDLWRGPRGTTGGGDPLVRSAEIADALSLNRDAVEDSLQRLEATRRVRNSGGTLDNPAPFWHVLRR